MGSAKFTEGEEVWMDNLFYGRIKVKIVRNEAKIPATVTSDDRIAIQEVHAYTVEEVGGNRRWTLVPETFLSKIKPTS